MTHKVLLWLLAGTLVAAQNNTTKRLEEAGLVMEEIMGAGDKAIPQDLLERAHCVVVVPGLKKGAFIFGAKYGKGFITCRREGNAGWSAPGSVRVEGGSFGFQIGGEESDAVLLVMNQRGADRLLTSKFTLGGAGEVAAGPVGRSATAQTDATMRAEILSYSRSRGVFAGLSLQGATLRQDLDSNQEVYGKKLENRQIVRSTMSAPASGKKLLGLLGKYSFKERK